MAPMGIRLSPLGVAVFFLLGLGVLYHLYSGFLAGRFSLFGLGGEPAGGAAEVAVDGGTVDLREMLAVAVLAAERGGDEVRRVRESNVLHEKSKGKTREGAEDKMTSGDVLSNRKMFYLLKTAFPNVQVGAGSRARSDLLSRVPRHRRNVCKVMHTRTGGACGFSTRGHAPPPLPVCGRAGVEGLWCRDAGGPHISNRLLSK